MIILEPTQLPKLDTHLPPGPNGVHIRFPAPAVHPDLTIRRPRSSLSTSASTLPDYETSQKAHVVVQDDDDDEDDPSSPRQNSRRRFRRFPRFYPFSPFRRHAAPLSKPWRALLALYYTFLIYTLVGSIIVVPVLVGKTRSSNRQVKEYKEFLQSPPPTIDIPLYGSHKVSMAVPGMGNSTFDCDVWVLRPPAKSDDRKQKQYYSATLNVSLPVSPVLHLSTTNGSQGSLAVALNPNRSETSIVLSGSLSTDTLSLLHNTTLCTTQTSNTTSIALTAPPSCSKQDPSYAVNLTLLLPSSAGSRIKEFATYAPGFAQKFEALAPDVTFTTVALEGSGAGAPIDFASIVAETIVVKTAYAPVSGTLNVTGALLIDTVFAPVDVNVSLANYAPCENPTSASLSTGNAPLRVNFILAAASLPPPYWPNFILKAQTFNAPLNMTLSHAPSTPGARTFLNGITAAGPLTLVADALFAGTFDLSTKAANAIVDHPTNHSSGKGQDYDYDKDGDIDDDDDNDNNVTSLKFDYQGPGRALGWTGLGARPSDDDQGCLELEASLDNVALELVQMRGVPGAVEWASDNLWG